MQPLIPAFQRGVAAMEQGRHAEAMNHYREVLASHPLCIEAWVNAGNVARAMGKYQEALQLLTYARTLNPHVMQTWYNLGHVRRDVGDFMGALQAFEAAAKVDDKDPETAYEMACELLRRGSWMLGWMFFSKRKHDRALPPCPAWDGQSLEGKHLLVTPEQGIGEMVMFSRAVAAIAAGKVTFAVDRRMKSLFERAFPYVNICCDELPEADYHIRVGDLFGRLYQLPWEVPRGAFLSADAVDVKKKRRDGPTIGFALKSAVPEIGDAKTIPHDAIGPLVHALGHVNLVSLQSDDAIEGVEPLDIDDRGDLEALCSRIMACDVVICGSNSVAHLSAAMGVPTWILLPKARGLLWHWGLGQDVPPMYGQNAVLFRQKVDGDWRAPIEEIMRRLTGENAETTYTGTESVSELVSKFNDVLSVPS